MNLQTKIPLKPSANQLDYDSKVLLVGSCFVEHIGAKLEYFKFQNLVNPFGILFQPEAIARFFEAVETQKQFTESDLEKVNGLFVSLDAHSELGATTTESAVNQLNTAIQEAFAMLQNASHLVITLGTAWGYRHKEQGNVVANCHKIPQKEFQKELTSITEVEAALLRVLSAVENLNSKASVIFSVSPVRHLKDGFVENQRSKAHLIAAVHSILAKNKRVEYFPSYEIMMDELRDYRFYDRDLIHPNPLAVDYIWERFLAVYLSPQAKKTIDQVEEIQRGLAHKAFNPDSVAHQKFLQKLDDKIKALQAEVPDIRF
ncbi:GSCFA family protein [Leeuwenhoekiella aestuarii]|uniref:GSCFA family protein n=1 Tax=Leeuwenhoekiella aestuarii TaxID=2249426 RepID=A0A4V1KNR9_9FLAO|nr:GSCFA domain-containing protein [Leeuwenhoekiella aestuarii]RXG11747.1 GSCFA family protein [Leeuwenhoekiella aestuarii]RXG12802.1 GSCFA family protein [Leeuwenhoekiella aestuarii]